MLFESRGWHIRESLAQNVRLESRNIGWRELGGVQSEDDVPEPVRVNKTSAWFGAVWQNRMLYLTDFDYWGAEFLLDPLQPAVRIIRLINELTPVQGSVDLLARYFNERSSEISCACRAFVVAHLMQSSVAGVEHYSVKRIRSSLSGGVNYTWRRGSVAAFRNPDCRRRVGSDLGMRGRYILEPYPHCCALWNWLRWWGSYAI